MAHGRGVARLNNTVVGQLSWVEARTNQSHGCAPFLLPVSHPNPSGGSTSAKRSVDIFPAYQVKLSQIDRDVISLIPPLHEQHHGIFVAELDDGFFEVFAVFDGIIIYLPDHVPRPGADAGQVGILLYLGYHDPFPGNDPVSLSIFAGQVIDPDSQLAVWGRTKLTD